MKITTLDFETFYSKEYSLRKMTPAEYILDPRFEGIGCAVKDLGEKAYWVDGPDLQKWFKQADTSRGYITFNALFDMCICSFRYGFVPKLMIDALGIARATLGHVLPRLNLKAVSQHLNLGVKGETVLKVEGMGYHAIKAAGLMPEYARYSMNDAELAEGVFTSLVPSRFPVEELAIMDMVLRCAVEPSFRLDLNLLALHLNDIKLAKAQLLTECGLTPDANGKCPDLMSNEKFAQCLRRLGVEPPMKKSKTTGQEAYAFAKSDVEFLELEDHDDPKVQALIAARLGHKTTLEETRTQRYINIANLHWPKEVTPEVTPRLMPMPLRFSGAHTHRLSGDWKLNVQNLGRGSKLRRALIAPPGHKVVTIDASQIEARLNGWLAGQEDLVQQFANKEDVYAIFASKVFGFEVRKKEHPTERFVGKQAVLGLGYQLAAPGFVDRLEVDSKNQTGNPIRLPIEEGMRIVNVYRSTNHAIVSNNWRRLQYEGLPALLTGREFQHGPLVFEKEAILLPNGLRLHYHGLHQDGGDWWFTYGGRRKKIYGGKLTENICQALARILTFSAAIRIQARARQELGATIRLKSNAHDENVFIVPDELVESVVPIMYEEMRRRPDWGPDIPLDAEHGVGQSYGEAK